MLNFDSHYVVFKIQFNFQPMHKAIFSAVDQDQDGILSKEEQRNHINTVRDTMGINYQSGPPGRPGPRSPPGRPGPTTPMPPPGRDRPIPPGRDRPIPQGRPDPMHNYKPSGP